ncbi:MAG TPA: YhdP family protein [Verrucomicrobiae bacterium]|nr:YhdP family protein [Verrucomicrobiae bacterium]
MERTRRRFWGWAISGGAVLVIFAAAASGLFQLAVQAVPGYRADVESYVRELTGRPIRIGSLGLTWRYYYPSLELNEVALLADNGETIVLQAERLRLGFGVTHLIRGDYMPTRLELHGLNLDARIDADGQFSIEGIDAGGAGDEPFEALRPLTGFDALRLERCRLNVRDARRLNETWSFGIAHAQLERGLLGDSVDAEIALPASIGDAALFEGAFTGEWLQPKTWTGTGMLRLKGLAPGAWLAPYLGRGARLDAASVEARLRGRLEQGRLAEVRAEVRSGKTRAQRAQHAAGFDSLEARVNVEFLVDGWLAKLERLGLEVNGSAWPEVRGELRATSVEGAPPIYEATLNYLRLDELAPWLRVLPVPDALATMDGARGELRDLQLRLQRDDDETHYSYRAHFEALTLPAAGRAAGFSGARGEVAGDERGGRAVLQESPLKVELPGLLLTPEVPLELFEAEAEWRRRESGWRIALPQFRWQLWTTRGQGKLELTLPDAPGSSPEIDLSAQFSADDATRAKPLMPQHWGTGLTTWLDRAIVAGRAPRGELRIKGPLTDFPFDQKATGEWALDIDAENVVLAYQPDWPAVEDVSATLKFRGSSLAIEATRGIISGNPIERASARFPDFGTGQLLVDGRVSGEIARYYEFLANSPLRETFRTLLAQTSAAGPASVDIHLDIPVSDAINTQVSGRVGLAGVELRHSALPVPIRDIRGEIDFDRAGVESQKLAARLYDQPLEATLTPQSPEVTLLKAGFRYAVDPQGGGASELVPAWIRSKLAGASAWRAELAFGGPGEPLVKLSTDLVGVTVKLPPPLGKPAEQAVPLALSIGSKPGTPLHIAVDYQERFGADLHFARARGAMAMDRGALRVGGGPHIAATGKGLSLGGQVAELDARAWADELRGSGVDADAGLMRRADLHVGRARWDRYSLRDTRYQWTTQKGGWLLSLIGAGAIGEARWSAADRGQLGARLDQLALEVAPPTDDTDATEGTLDPGQLPLFDFDVRRLAVNQAELGRVVFATQRTELGQKLRALKIEGGTTTASAEGEWRRRAGQSSAVLNGDLTTADIAALLRAFHYTPNLDAKVARFKGALTWAPAPALQWHQAEGTVHLEFENGQLRAVEPGAGRVLGLVNFYALPRRLTLNFRDVLSSGLGFDKVEGDFELREGNARTQNLRIAGPSLRMEMKGRIGLTARDYDQQVTVYPDVSAGVTLGAVLLGGPVAGVLALIAQELLDKPLNQVTQLSYRLTGSWDNPQVERAPQEGPVAPLRAPDAPARKSR